MRRRAGREAAPAVRGLEVELRAASVLRDGRRVLHDIDWRVRTGERWVVVGENGAGKTQLLKLLAGRVWPEPRDAGRRGATALAPIEYRFGRERSGVAEPVRERIAYLGPELQDRYDRLDWNHRVDALVATGIAGTDIPLEVPSAPQRRRVAQVLRSLGIEALARRRLLTLSYGQRRLALLARALAASPALLLLDELLAGLDAAHRERVLRALDAPPARGRGWVLTAHRLEELPRSATHLLELRAGRVRRRLRLQARGVGPSPPGATSRSRERAAAAPVATVRHRVAGTPRVASVDAGRGAPLLRLSRARVFLDWKPVIRGISFEVRGGEAWVVHGPNGSGKTTLLRAIYGDFPVAAGGRLEREGIEPGVPIAEFRERCALLAPHLQTDYPQTATALETVVSGLHASYGLNESSTAAERAAARRSLAALGLGSLADRRLSTLSYGQARRVLFARAWVRRPALLLLDEPYAGVDRRTRVRLQRDVEALRRAGVAVLISTHHRDEWPRAATHELELRQGRAVYAGVLRARPDGRMRA